MQMPFANGECQANFVCFSPESGRRTREREAVPAIYVKFNALLHHTRTAENKSDLCECVAAPIYANHITHTPTRTLNAKNIIKNETPVKMSAPDKEESKQQTQEPEWDGSS